MSVVKLLRTEITKNYVRPATMVPTTLVPIKSDRSTIRNDNVIVRMIVWYNADPCRFELYWIGIGNGLVLNDFDKSIIILLDKLKLYFLYSSVCSSKSSDP